MDKKIYDKMTAKVEKDYQELIVEYKNKSVDQVIKSACTIAYYNEVYNMICHFCIDSEEFDWLEDEEGRKIANYKGNFVSKIYTDYLDYHHPERYNFFYFDGFIEVIEHTLRHLGD